MYSDGALTADGTDMLITGATETVFAIVIGATYALDLALETQKKRYYILYAILLALGMWTHYFTALAWLAHVVYITAVKKINIFKLPASSSHCYR